jgi:two-component system chemotaxis sensor kinase CheA
MGVVYKIQGVGYKMKMDMSQYLDVFLEESKENLDNLNKCLLELEKDTKSSAALNEIFRVAHTLKGMSSTMGFHNLANLTHHMENVLSDLKEGILTINGKLIDTLFQCLDRVQMIIEQIEKQGNEKTDNNDLIRVLESIKSNPQATFAREQLTSNMQNNENDPMPEDFTFNQYDITVIEEAINKNYKVYNAKITVEPGCLMKSVRVFMVFKVVEEDGEIIKTIPSAQDLDEGKFDDNFAILIITRASLNQLEQRIRSISEITEVIIQEININDLGILKKQNIKSNPNIPNNSPDDLATYNHNIKHTVRVDIDRLDNLMNLVGELVMHKGRLEQIGLSHQISELNETIEQISRVSTDLQAIVMKVRMVPVEQVFNRFPRMVRDLAHNLNKEVDFLIEGKDTELDRTVIDEIGDPLVHLLRNAIDHGLELPQERINRGKEPTGKVILRARHEGNNVFIEVEDDGAGVDTIRVMEKAVEKGMLTPREGEELTREEIIDLLFTPGFSTAQSVTSVSGRGVGLDAVKAKIESLSGEIFINSREGQGTQFRIKLPLTLAIIQALMVAVQDEIYAIPLSSVNETTMITAKDIKIVQNQEVIVLRGSVLPLFRLGQLLGTPGEDTAEEMYVVIVRKMEQQIGLVVDSLIGQQEIVIKSLGRLLAGIPGLAGAIVSGDGNVRLILDITTLF